jgi:hypothetical protein
MRSVKTLLIGLWSYLVLATGSPALAKSPLVVELFTSQACASCLEANSIIHDLNKQTDIIGLTFAVDYWDYLGWHDSFAKAAFTERQKAYMRKLAAGEVYTPQIVVNGTAQVAGTKPDKVERLIAAAKRRPPNSPRLSLTGTQRLAVGRGALPRGGAEIWLVSYEPQQQAVEVKRGENRGKTVVYTHAVRELVRLGNWRGKSKTFALPKATSDGLERLVLVQGSRGGPIVAAMKLKPSSSSRPENAKYP